MTASSHWHDLTSWAEVVRRAAGRRKYNATRKLKAQMRQAEIERLWVGQSSLGTVTLFRHGYRAELARRLGVHRSTIGRDMEAILARWREEDPIV